MATRSAIGISHGGVIKSVYCHWDGYLEGVGRTLLESYNKSPAVNKLISMGSISSLNPTIDDTVFYCRDRGEDEKECSWVISHSREEFIKEYRGCDYYYLYENGEWYYASYKNKSFEKLEYGVVLEALTQ